MTFGERLKTLRREFNLSQEICGTRGFVSTPGWIKVENGQRQASEKLIERLARWLVEDKYMRSGAAGTLKEELLTLKYLGSRSTFVREMARSHAGKAAQRRGHARREQTGGAQSQTTPDEGSSQAGEEKVMRLPMARRSFLIGTPQQSHRLDKRAALTAVFRFQS